MESSYKDRLQLPSKSLLERKLTKAFFLRNFKLSAAEKRMLSTDVEAMQWLASLKSSTTNIPAVQTDRHSFEEIQLFRVKIGEGRLETRYKAVAQMIHKYIPYQILLFLEGDDGLVCSVCEKRINQADSSKRTIEAYQYTPIISTLYQRQIETDFWAAMAFGALEKQDLQSCYESYRKAIVQYIAARMTGQYQQRSRARTKEDLETLRAIEQLETEIVSLESQIKKETQFNRKTKLNIDLHQKRNTIQSLQDKLNRI